MTYQYVESSKLRSVGYDPETCLLEVELYNRGTFQYSGVPENVYQSLLKASSIGKYFLKNVKDVYPEKNLY